MSMLATLEGVDTVAEDDYILGRMFSPNDGLGVELLGVEGWNAAKQKVATAARNALKAKRLFIVPEIIYCDPTPCRDDLAGVLFGLDEEYSKEMLGFSLTKAVKKAASGAAKSVKSATKSVKKKVKKATFDPVGSAKDLAKKTAKTVVKYSRPDRALQMTLSPTYTAKAISETDPTGISTELVKKNYKFAPDVLPTAIAEKTTKKSVKYDPTGISQKLYKGVTGFRKATAETGPEQLFRRAKRTVTPKDDTETTVETVTTPAATAAQQPTFIYYPQPIETTDTTATTETGSFDWSNLINWKTALFAGGVAYFVFGRRGKRGKRK